MNGCVCVRAPARPPPHCVPSFPRGAGHVQDCAQVDESLLLVEMPKAGGRPFNVDLFFKEMLLPPDAPFTLAEVVQPFTDDLFESVLAKSHTKRVVRCVPAPARRAGPGPPVCGTFPVGWRCTKGRQGRGSVAKSRNRGPSCACNACVAL